MVVRIIAASIVRPRFRGRCLRAGRVGPGRAHRRRRHAADRARAGRKHRRHARARHERAGSRIEVRRADQQARPARRPEAPVADHQPLDLSHASPSTSRRTASSTPSPTRPTPTKSARSPPSADARNRNTAQQTFPAEWEPQSAVLIAWPHADTDWAERLGEVEETYIALVAALVRYTRVIVCVADEDLQTYAEARLRSARVDLSRVRFVEVAYDDTWLRDSGPITLRTPDGFRLLDFRFTGWGGKFEASRDDQLIERLVEQGVFDDAQRTPIDFALEGGAIETDGAGTLLTTWRCLHERHPDDDRASLEARLKRLAAPGPRAVARLTVISKATTPTRTSTPSPASRRTTRSCSRRATTRRIRTYAELRAMGDEIAALRTKDGKPYRLFPLPWAQPILDEGSRAPPCRVVCELPDRRRRRADAVLRRSRRCAGRRRA